MRTMSGHQLTSIVQYYISGKAFVLCK